MKFLNKEKKEEERIIDEQEEERIRQDQHEKTTQEIYKELNLAELFADEQEAGFTTKLLPWINLGALICVLLLVLFK